MLSIFSRLQRHIAGFADRPFYPSLVAMVGAADYFVPGAPTNAIFISSILPKTAQWLKLSIYFSVGCAFGAFLLGTLMGFYGDAFADWVVQSEAAGLWQRIEALISRYGLLVLSVLSLIAAPVRIAIAILALAGYMPLVLAAIVLAGRLVAYPALAWLVSRAPAMVGRIPILGTLLYRARKSAV